VGGELLFQRELGVIGRFFFGVFNQSQEEENKLESATRLRVKGEAQPVKMNERGRRPFVGLNCIGRKEEGEEDGWPKGGEKS